MIIYCSNCNSAFEISQPYKGLNLTPIPCSFDCFMGLCRKEGKPLSSNVVIKKNKKIKIFRSSLEESFAKLLEAKKVKYMFEPYIVTKKINGKTRYYLPDFFLPTFNIFIEIKGNIWGKGAYTKFKEIKEILPILLISREILTKIKQSKKEFYVKGVVNEG